VAVLASTTVVTLSAAAPAGAEVCTAPSPDAPVECTQRPPRPTLPPPPTTTPPPPPPPPDCDLSPSSPTRRVDERPTYARSFLVGSVIAEVTPHIEWCGTLAMSRAKINMFADITVIPRSVFFIGWDYVGGKSGPYVDGEGQGRYVQSIKITGGAAIEVGNRKIGAVSSCVLTINRTYTFDSTEPVIEDDPGDCTSIFSQNTRHEATFSPIPGPGVVSYPPVEVVWIDLPAREETDVRITTTLEVVEFSWETDIIDAPLGGGGGAGDIEWADYFVEESIGCLG
jgi:hypothetical protein